jgi:hypothetical protein
MLSVRRLKSRGDPMEVTTYGSLSGSWDRCFCYRPWAVSLRRREEPPAVAALVFGANYFSNIGTRFLIPVLPLSRAMALALARAAPAAGHGSRARRHFLAFRDSSTAAGKHSACQVPWREALQVKPGRLPGIAPGQLRRGPYD